MLTGSLDAAFTVAIGKGLEEVCSVTADAEDLLNSGYREVQYLLGFAPRLYSFSHRPILSLRHPYLSMVVVGHHTDGSSPVDRMSAVDTTTSTSSHPPILLIEATKWCQIGALYDQILHRVETTTVEVHCKGVGTLSAPLLQTCRSRIENHPGVCHAIAKYWRMLCGGSAIQKHMPRCARDVDFWFEGESITAAAYMYLCVRLSDLLYGEPSALLDLAEFMVGDLVVDAMAQIASPQPPPADEGTPASNPDTPSTNLFGKTDFCEEDNSIEDEPSVECDDVVPPSPSSSSEESSEEEVIDPMSAAAFCGMPSLSFAEFKRGLLEVVDNWSTTIHPNEWAALLMQWFGKVFTLQDTKLLQFQAKGGRKLLGPATNGTPRPVSSGSRLGQFNTGVAPGGLAASQQEKAGDTEAQRRERRRLEVDAQRQASKQALSDSARKTAEMTALLAMKKSIDLDLQNAIKEEREVSPLQGWDEFDASDEDLPVTVPTATDSQPMSPIPPKSPQPNGEPASARRRARAQRNRDYHAAHFVPSTEASRSSSGTSSPLFIGGGGHRLLPPKESPHGVRNDNDSDYFGDSAVLQAVHAIRRPLFYSMLGSRYGGDRLSPQREGGDISGHYTMRCLATQLFLLTSIPTPPTPKHPPLSKRL